MTAFSSDFAYNLWTPNTELTLTRVPWDNTGANIHGLKTRNDFNIFIDSQPGNTKITFANDARANEPIVIDMLYNDALLYNYIRATNNVQSAVAGSRKMDFYYFILGAKHVSTHTTELILQLDVWATYFDQVEFGNAYIEQGHAGVADENNFDNFGRDKLTISEGLDIGTEYAVYMKARVPLMNAPTNYSVMIGSSLDLEEDQGSSYEDAKNIMAKGSVVNGLISGVSFYVFDTPGLAQGYLEYISKRGWIGAGIVSINAIPNMSEFVEGWSEVPTLDNVNGAKLAPVDTIKHRFQDALPSWREAIIDYALPERYKKFRKFLTSPYCVVELTAFNGQPLMLKPENWQNADGRIGIGLNILPPGQRATFYPWAYNRWLNEEPLQGAIDADRGDSGGDYFDMATTISGFPSFAYVGNTASSILAQNRGGLAFSREAADWSQQRTLEANRLGYEQAGSAIGLNTDLTELANAGIRESRGISDQHAFWNTGIDTVGNLGDLSVGSSLMAGARAMSSASEANNQAALQQRQNSESSRMTGQNAEYLRDTNKKMADWGARGDYSLQIAALDAKVRDINMTPPSIIGQVGGDTFNMVAAPIGLGLSIRFKMVDDGTIRRIGEHWIRYGYQVHQRVTEIPELNLMTHFTYWKLQELYFKKATIPEGYRTVIQGLFSKGTTVWADPNEIGKIDMGRNEAKPGFRL